MFGDDVMELFSRNLFLLSTLHRMCDSAASSGREQAVRANVKAKRYGDTATATSPRLRWWRSFLRTGTAEIPDPCVPAKWGLENKTFWNVAHMAGEGGKAME